MNDKYEIIGLAGSTAAKLMLSLRSTEAPHKEINVTFAVGERFVMDLTLPIPILESILDSQLSEPTGLNSEEKFRSVDYEYVGLFMFKNQVFLASTPYLEGASEQQATLLIKKQTLQDANRLKKLQQVVIDSRPSALPTTTILFLSADPTTESRLRLGEEFREISEQLTLAKMRDHFKLAFPQLSLRPKDISRALLNEQPQIVHFSGHGTSTGALCFENEAGESHLVQPGALAALFEQFTDQVKCVLLNACYAEIQAKAIAEHIDYVIGMNQAISDKAAIAFALGFYQALGAGRTIEQSFDLGRAQIGFVNYPEHLTPVLIKKKQE